MRSKIDWLMNVAHETALLSTCARRKVGAVLADVHARILSTGFNGVARGVVHCIDSPCPGAKAKSGEKLDLCEAIHAEQNALLQCSDTDRISSIFVTASPCLHCIKLLMNTGCMNIYAAERYPGWERAFQLWTASDTRRRWYWYEDKPLCIQCWKIDNPGSPIPVSNRVRLCLEHVTLWN